MDVPLDDTGVAQARAVGEVLRRAYPGARVISSPLLRALDTARAIAEEPEIDARFIELDYGDWDGLAMSELGDAWRRWREDPHLRPPNGETLVELDDRVRPALLDLSGEARNGNVIVVSHVSPIKSAVTWALGAGPELTWRLSLHRASICCIRVGPNGPVLESFNETGHLEGLGK